MEANALQRLAVFAASAFVFLYVSRIMDLSFSFLHLPLVCSAFSLVIISSSGLLRNFVKMRAGIVYGLLTLWVILAGAFGVWRSGSLQTITSQWLRSVLVCVIVLSTFTTVQQTLHLMNTMAAASLFAAVMALKKGIATTEGRVLMAGSTLDNPNDLAFVLLIGIPLWWRVLTSESAGRLHRCLALVALPLTLTCYLKTGSRGGMLAVFTMLVVAFFRVSFSRKLILTALAGLTFAVAFASLPAGVKDRYSMLLTATDISQDSLDESAKERQTNLMDSIRMTLHHPVFGVGPGNFTVAQDASAKEMGLLKGSWLGTHNTYTQVSSECGIPALILFLCLIIMSIRSIQAARNLARKHARPESADIQNTALYTELLLWGACVFVFFAHVGFNVGIHLLISLGLVFGRAATRELTEVTDALGLQENSSYTFPSSARCTE